MGRRVITKKDVDFVRVMAPNIMSAKSEKENSKMRRSLLIFGLMCELERQKFKNYVPKEIADHYLKDTISYDCPIDYNEIIDMLINYKNDKGIYYLTKVQYIKNNNYDGIEFSFSKEFEKKLAIEVKERNKIRMKKLRAYFSLLR